MPGSGVRSGNLDRTVCCHTLIPVGRVLCLDAQPYDAVGAGLVDLVRLSTDDSGGPGASSGYESDSAGVLAGGGASEANQQARLLVAEVAPRLVEL